MAIAAFGTVLTAAYLAMVVRRVGLGATFRAWKEAVLLRDATTHELPAWSPVVALVVAFGLWPGWLLLVTDPAVRRLLGGA